MRRLLCLALLGASCAALAQPYRWIDPATGRTMISDQPPPGNARSVTKLNAPAENVDGTPYALRRAIENFPVTLYTAPDCASGCKEARELLTRRRVPFKEVAVQTAEQFDELKALAGELSVPVLKVGKQPVRGFNPDAYENVLDMAGYPKAASAGRPSGAAAP